MNTESLNLMASEYSCSGVECVKLHTRYLHSKTFSHNLTHTKSPFAGLQSFQVMRKRKTYMETMRRGWRANGKRLFRGVKDVLTFGNLRASFPHITAQNINNIISIWLRVFGAWCQPTLLFFRVRIIWTRLETERGKGRKTLKAASLYRVYSWSWWGVRCQSQCALTHARRILTIHKMMGWASPLMCGTQSPRDTYNTCVWVHTVSF